MRWDDGAMGVVGAGDRVADEVVLEGGTEDSIRVAVGVERKRKWIGLVLGFLIWLHRCSTRVWSSRCDSIAWVLLVVGGDHLELIINDWALQLWN